MVYKAVAKWHRRYARIADRNPVIGPFRRKAGIVRPTLNEIFNHSNAVATNAWELSGHYGIEKSYTDFEKIWKPLEKLLSKQENRNYPSNFALEKDEAYFLYSLIRAHRPAVILETGVADGAGTCVMLKALQENKKGVLHSVEISENVGGSVHKLFDKGFLDRTWKLHIIKPGHGFGKIAEEVGAIDMFLHDSDHGYPNQMTEYRIAYDRLKPGGLFLSDDVDFSFAFIDFTKNVKKPDFLVTRRKVMGAFKK